MRYKQFLIILLLVCLISVGLFYPLSTAIVFTETRSSHPSIIYMPLGNDRNFQIRYTHSIHLSDVIESYRTTKDHEIQLLSMEYEDLAIGLPGYAEEGQQFMVKDGKYILTYNHQYLHAFTIHIADIDTDLELSHNQKKYDLKRNLERGKSYEFEVKELSFFDKMKGVKMDDKR